MVLESVGAVLIEAEERLLAVLAEAAKKRDYDGIDQARRAAEELRSLRARLDGGVGSSKERSRASRPPPSAGSGVRRTEEPRSSGKGRRKYPRFRISDSNLVKVGWSKKRGSEYTQRIPKSAFDDVLEGLGAAASVTEGPISSDILLEQVAAIRADLPSYQTYAVIRFLRKGDVIRQVNRGEYAVPGNVQAAGQVAWDQLERTDGQ